MQLFHIKMSQSNQSRVVYFLELCTNIISDVFRPFSKPTERERERDVILIKVMVRFIQSPVSDALVCQESSTPTLCPVFRYILQLVVVFFVFLLYILIIKSTESIRRLDRSSSEQHELRCTFGETSETAYYGFNQQVHQDGIIMMMISHPHRILSCVIVCFLLFSLSSFIMCRSSSVGWSLCEISSNPVSVCVISRPRLSLALLSLETQRN